MFDTWTAYTIAKDIHRDDMERAAKRRLARRKSQQAETESPAPKTSTPRLPARPVLGGQTGSA
jgi:hypothetical protein